MCVCVFTLCQFCKWLLLTVRMNCLIKLRVGANPHTSLLATNRRNPWLFKWETPIAFPRLLKRVISNLDPGQTPEVHQETPSCLINIHGRMADWCFQPHSHLSQGVFTKLLSDLQGSALEDPGCLASLWSLHKDHQVLFATGPLHLLLFPDLSGSAVLKTFHVA